MGTEVVLMLMLMLIGLLWLCGCAVVWVALRWLVGRLVGQLVGWLAGWFLGSLGGWLVEGAIGFVALLVGWLFGLSFG